MNLDISKYFKSIMGSLDSSSYPHIQTDAITYSKKAFAGAVFTEEEVHAILVCIQAHVDELMDDIVRYADGNDSFPFGRHMKEELCAHLKVADKLGGLHYVLEEQNLARRNIALRIYESGSWGLTTTA